MTGTVTIHVHAGYRHPFGAALDLAEGTVLNSDGEQVRFGITVAPAAGRVTGRWATPTERAGATPADGPPTRPGHTARGAR